MEITNAQGSFMVDINVATNLEGKPESVRMSGSSYNIKAVETFIRDLKEKKEARGFHRQESLNPDDETYTKGSLYTRFYSYIKIPEFTMDLDTSSGWKLPDIFKQKKSEGIIFDIENGDVKRIAGSRAKTVDF